MAKRRGPRAAGGHRPLALRSTHWKADGTAKVRFSNRDAARSVANERAMDSGVQLNVYACDFCSGWHLGGSGDRPD